MKIKYSFFEYLSLKIKLELFRLELLEPGSSFRNSPDPLPVLRPWTPLGTSVPRPLNLVSPHCFASQIQPWS